MTIKRGDMFYADLSPVVGSEQGGIRPVLIIQNDLGNKYNKSSTVLIFSEIRCPKVFTPTPLISSRFINFITS